MQLKQVSDNCCAALNEKKGVCDGCEHDDFLDPAAPESLAGAGAAEAVRWVKPARP